MGFPIDFPFNKLTETGAGFTLRCNFPHYFSCAQSDCAEATAETVAGPSRVEIIVLIQTGRYWVAPLIRPMYVGTNGLYIQ